MNEEETRALVRGEIRRAFQAAKHDADWATGDSDHAVRGYVLRVVSAMEAALRAFPEPEPEPCHHAYAINAKGHSLCQLCGSPRPQASEPEPANPFAPKNTARQWADMIANLCRLAQDDGHPVWIENAGYGHPIRLRVGSADTAPAAWSDPND